VSRVDLNEFLDAYLGEVDENLAAGNALLLAIDAAHRRGEAAPRQVRDLFRALHTVKGLSSMVGVEAIVAISHRMETTLRTADRAGGAIRAGAVDVLLQGMQAIEQRARALGAGHAVPAPPPALLEALDALEDLAPERRPLPEARLGLDPALDAKLAPFERDTLARGVREGRRAICARFAPSHRRAEVGTNINTVRERLATVAEIVKVVPIAVERSDDAPAGLAFALLALTEHTDADVARALELEDDAISTIAEPITRELPALELKSDPSSGLDLLPDDETVADGDGDGGELVAGGLRRSFVRVDVARLDEALERLSALIVGRATLAREVARMAELGVDVRALQSILAEQARQVRDLRGAILRVRMVPVSEVLERVPLIVRGLRRATGKSVRLEIDAGRAELDKAVAERIFPAIVHLVRNAVDHAIEPREERLRAGKPDDGLVRIECRARGNGQLELRVIDDGRGIDAAAVAARAGREVPTTDAALLQLLCRPGLSTRDEVSATSGRGMGMDIVRKVVVAQLGGELALDTVPGRGTTFSLRVPLTISIVDAFTFECASQRFVVPLSTIDEIVEIDPARVAQAPDARRAGSLGMIERRGESVPLVQLEEILGLVRRVGDGATPPRPGSAGSKALIVRREGDALAFAVDRMLGQQEIVVRPLEDPLLAIEGIAGATDLGDGRPTLVVDLFALGGRRAMASGAVGS
jgi:two-component system chemotaxis sensor kinase CheA